jgi:hypothetical protein
MARIWCCSARVRLPVMADSMGVRGFPHSMECSVGVKVRREDEKEPNDTQITEHAIHKFMECYGVEATVLATYVDFILWDNI